MIDSTAANSGDSGRRSLIRRMTWRHEGVAELVDALDRYQIDLYGIESCHLESIDELQQSGAVVFGVFEAETLMGIGAIRVCAEYAEIKRVYVKPIYRGRGAAMLLMQALTEEAVRSDVTTLCLETGRLHFSALRLYERLGFVQVESFGSYVPNAVSIYMRKELWSDRSGMDGFNQRGRNGYD